MQPITPQPRPSHPLQAGRRQQTVRIHQRSSHDGTSGGLRNAQAKPAPSSHPTWEELLGER